MISCRERGGKENNILVLCLYASFDTKHFLEGVFVSVLDFERLPFLPETGIGSRVAELGCVSVNGTSPIDFAQPSLHLCKLQTHFLGFLVRQSRNSPFIDGSRGGQSEVRGGFRDIEFEHFESVLVGHRTSRAFVYPHRMSCQTALFFEVTIHQVKRLSKLGRAFVQGLFEEVTQSFDSDLPVHGFGQIEVPKLKRNRITEEVQPSFVDLERIFKVFVFLHQIGVVDNSLRSRDAQFKDTLIDVLGLIQGSDTLNQVDIETPQFPTLVDSLLGRKGLVEIVHSGLLGRLRRFGHDLNRLIEILTPQLHLCPFAPCLG